MTGSRPPLTICVYCGSSPGREPAYREAARDLGRRIAQAGAFLIYGGGDRGLMGDVARAAVENGGFVTGVIPRFLAKRERLEKPEFRIQETIAVADMHQRKQIMYERADAFIALPGGVGTLEELVEQLTWAQLGRHKKPIVIASFGGFWRPLLGLFAHMRESGFIHRGTELHYMVAERAEEILPMIEAALKKTPDAEEDVTHLM